MAPKWVDNSAYFGPDRRKPGRKRLIDRRRYDESGEPPSLPALLRRARVRANGPTPDDRRHALKMLKAAMAEAQRLGWRQCAAAIVQADDALRTGDGDPIRAEECIVRALDHAGAGR